MSKHLFDDNDSGEDISFKESEYSKKYNTLRRKEELLKLKNKYGDQINESDSSSSEDDDDEVIFTQKFERDFFKTLSCLKNKDPRIYDKDIKFFENENVIAPKQSNKAKNDKPMTIRDYNRELILNNKTLDDEEEDGYDDFQNTRSASPSHIEEQNQIKEIFSKVIHEDENEDDQEDNELGGLFSKKQKTKVEEEEEERSYHEWLAGQAEHLKNDSDEKELKPLKEYWSNPMLDKDEAFLRDYVLNQGFKEPSNSSKIPSYEEIVNEDDDDLEEDEKHVGKQTEFEHKFNFRFEEPDQEFIKQYPRTLEHSLRAKDQKRAKKRAEIKIRKIEEKERKREEIKQLQSLKLKEIQEKIVKLKEITGNEQLAFEADDIEGDFDPEAHDRRMRELFNENYYGEDADDKKPEFPDLDEELEIENWESWDVDNGPPDNSEPHCEDEDFNMDCDYDPSKKNTSLIDEIKNSVEGINKRKRKKKGKLAEALLKEKPVFDPIKLNKSLSEYIDEYYKLDCEDIVGDIPCRFKYREVPPCDYGLTMEEILLADDAELNRWYPLKKTLQHRPEHLQKNDQKIYSNRARDINLKRKILPSLFKLREEESNAEEGADNISVKKKKKKNKKKRKIDDISGVDNDNGKNAETSANKKRKLGENDDISADLKSNLSKLKTEQNDTAVENKSTKKKKSKLIPETSDSESKQLIIDTSHNGATGEGTIKPKKHKKKKNDISGSNQNDSTESVTKNTNKSTNDSSDKKKKIKNQNQFKGKGKKDGKNNNVSSTNKLTDERLKAYGINPKKYRGFMKFKKY